MSPFPWMTDGGKRRIVHFRDAHKTKQFWLIWAVLCLNVSAGIGVIGMASPMLQEIFGASAAVAAGFTGLISLFNIGGRFFWASLSDRIGRKATYATFFLLGIALYASAPSLARSGNQAAFVLAVCVIVSMYGGGFATIPAYLADTFGTQLRRCHSRTAADRMVDRRHHRSGARELHPGGADRGRRPASAGVRLHDVHPRGSAGARIRRERVRKAAAGLVVCEGRRSNHESRIPNPESRRRGHDSALARRALAWTAVGVPLGMGHLGHGGSSARAVLRWPLTPWIAWCSKISPRRAASWSTRACSMRRVMCRCGIRSAPDRFSCRGRSRRARDGRRHHGVHARLHPCNNDARKPFIERFLHGGIYQKRADVMAIAHGHSAAVIPFGLVEDADAGDVSQRGVPRGGRPRVRHPRRFGATDIVISSAEKGAALADALGDKPVLLLRAHGFVAVAPDFQSAVFRAIFTEVSARVQLQAAALGGPMAALDEEEGRKADAINLATVGRSWELWKKRVVQGV